MKLDRKLFFKIHRWIGIKLSIIFFIVCFSGTLATLSHEMDWLFIPEMRAKPEKLRANKNQMVQNLKEQFPGSRIQFWMASREPYLCDLVYLTGDAPRLYAFVNPYTGKIQGSAVITFQRFFRDLHYYLFIPFQVGNFMVLAFGFLLLISLITALFFYKKWYQKMFELKTGKGLLVFFRSLHRLVGVWSVPFTLIFSITGIWYFIERANIGNVGRIANPPGPVIELPGENVKRDPSYTYSIDYDRALGVAQSVIPNLEIKGVFPPNGPERALYLNGTDGTPLVRDRANRVYLNPETYEVLEVQKAENLEAVTWLNDIADPIHFGYWGGLVTKIIWFIFGLGISSLVLTGIWISQKRKAKVRAKQHAPNSGIWKYMNWMVFLGMMGFMYFTLISRYQASITALGLITTGWIIFLVAAWYIFDFRLKKVAKEEVLA